MEQKSSKILRGQQITELGAVDSLNGTQVLLSSKSMEESQCLTVEFILNDRYEEWILHIEPKSSAILNRRKCALLSQNIHLPVPMASCD